MSRLVWAVAIGLGLVSCVATVVVLPDTPDREMARLNAQIEIELPRGTSRAAVKKWLRDRSDFDDISGANTDMRGLMVQAQRGYFWYWNGNLTIWFFFDEQDRFERHDIEFEELAL